MSLPDQPIHLTLQLHSTFDIPGAPAVVVSNLAKGSKVNAFITWVKTNQLVVVLFIGLGYFVYRDHFKSDGTPVNNVHDAIVTKLGADYKITLAKNGSSPFKAVANGSFDTIDELTQAQHKSANSAWTDAYAPIAKELESRFGKAEDGKASVRNVQSFFSDLDYGYGK